MSDMPWEDSEAELGGASRGGSWKPGGEYTRQELIERLVFQYRDQTFRVSEAIARGDKLENVDPVTGEASPGPLAAMMDRATVLADQLESFGVDVSGLPLDNPSKISASVSAQLADSAANRASREAVSAAEISARERLAVMGDAAAARENVLTREATSRENALTRAANEREAKASLAQRYTDTYITAVTDILDSEIRRGNLSVSEAEQRRSAATDAAQIQADLLTKLGGYQVAPGAQYFPGLGPSDPAAQIAQGMGFAPPTMGIGGTFTVSPGKMVDPIYGALAGMQGSGIADNAMQDAMSRLGALGVPLNGAPSRQQGVGMDPIAAALAAGG